jgi:protein TonB
MPRRAATTPRADAPARAAAAGNADRSARAGSDAGRQEAEAARAATRPAERTATSGNAAASNYPGLVMRHVSRARRPDVSARGAARVTFSIAGSGALAGARLARSSGSAALDRAALTVIRRAAPFPAPPAGAARTFTVEIRGR